MLLSNTLDRYGLTDGEHYYYDVRSYVSVYEDDTDIPVDKVRILSVYLNQEGQLTTELTPIRNQVLFPHSLTDHSRINDVIRAFIEYSTARYLGLVTEDGSIPVLPPAWGGFFELSPSVSMPDPNDGKVVYLFRRGLVQNRILSAVKKALT